MKSSLRLAASVLVLGLGGCAIDPGASRTSASEPMSGMCYECMKPINGHGSVIATFGSGHKRAYRCIHCALTDLHLCPERVVVRTRSRVSGKEIRLDVQSSRPWKADPPEAVFLILSEKNGNCIEVHQSFLNRDEYTSYVAEHPEIAERSPQPLTVAQYEGQFHPPAP